MKKLFAAAALLALLTFAASFALAAGEVPVPIRVTLEGVEYTLPFPVRQLDNNGWSYELSGAVAPFGTQSMSIEKDGKAVNVEIKNEHITEKSAADCMVYGVDSNIDVLVTVDNIEGKTPHRQASFLWEGIGVGTDYQTLLDKWSAVDLTACSLHSFTDFRSAYYSDLVDNYSFTLSIHSDNETGKIDKLFVCGETTTLSEETLAEIVASQSEIPVYRPESFSEYVAPGALGEKPLSGVFEAGGKLYRLPIPLEQLANDGWSFSEDDWIMPNEEMEVHLASGDGYGFDAYAHNIMNRYNSENEMESMPAKTLYSEAWRVSGDIRLPGGIHCGMSDDELHQAMENQAYLRKKEGADSSVVVYTANTESDTRRIDATFSVKNGVLEDIILEYSVPFRF